MTNIDAKTVDGFGEEWLAYDQSGLSEAEAEQLFERYFHIFPWDRLPKGAVGFDCGSGSGRWAARVASKVGELHCVDPSSKALAVARANCAHHANMIFHEVGVHALPFEPDSMDFGYSLGVLHHVPDTQAGISACVAALKPGAPFLLYLYSALDNRPVWFRLLWRISNLARWAICRLPFRLRRFTTDLIALLIYLPAARLARFLETRGVNVNHFPLMAYRHTSFYTMRTDALDRFGTRLEQRFTRVQMGRMMEKAGLENIVFSEAIPFWVAIGYKRA